MKRDGPNSVLVPGLCVCVCTEGRSEGWVVVELPTPENMVCNLAMETVKR